MKKRLFSLCVCLAMLFTLASVAVGAATSEEMVYASKDVRETLYAATQEESFDYFNALKSRGLKIVKESITVVYTIDMEELSDNGNLIVKPLLETDADDKRLYVAKVVTEEGEYAGNLMFSIVNGVACFAKFHFGMSLTHEESNASEKYRASCSYADHAVRIQNILKESDFISVYDVKYVHVDYIGQFFYIENQDEPIMIPVGYVNAEASDNAEKWWTSEKLKEQVDKIVEWERELKALKEAWEAEHPGETYYATIGGPSVISVSSGCGPIDNILNIDEYLGISNESQNKLPLICGIVTVIVLLTIGAGLYYRKRRKAE